MKTHQIGGRPPLGENKRHQHSTTYRPDHWRRLTNITERSGYNTDHRTHVKTVSMIVEEALDFYWKEKEGKKGKR